MSVNGVPLGSYIKYLGLKILAEMIVLTYFAFAVSFAFLAGELVEAEHLLAVPSATLALWCAVKGVVRATE